LVDFLKVTSPWSQILVTRVIEGFFVRPISSPKVQSEEGCATYVSG